MGKKGTLMTQIGRIYEDFYRTGIIRIKKKPPQSSLGRSTSPPIRKRTGRVLKKIFI